MVSHPETGSDPPIGSDRESGRDSRGVGPRNLPRFAYFIPFSRNPTKNPKVIQKHH